MSAPHQHVVSSIQATQSFSSFGRAHEPAAALLQSAGKRAAIAPLRDPRDATRTKQMRNEDIAILVLASGAGKDGPGPLVSTIGNKGFPIPVTVVPGTLTEEAVRALA